MTINFIDLMICVSVGRKSALSGSNQCECAGPLQTSNSQCDGTAVEHMCQSVKLEQPAKHDSRAVQQTCESVKAGANCQ